MTASQLINHKQPKAMKNQTQATTTKGTQTKKEDLTEKFHLPSRSRQRFTIKTIIADAIGCDLSDIPECVKILETLKK